MATPPKSHSRSTFEDRARSVPYRRCYVVGVGLCLAYYLCLLGAITSLVALIPDRDLAPAIILGTFMLLAGVFWFLSFLKRRDATCPLCKGTPLLDSQALKHQKAVRFFPLNYGTTNVVRIIFRQQFRCHFCGTPYDLLKEISSTREPVQVNPETLAPPDLPPAVIPPIAGTLPQEHVPAQVTPQASPAARSSEPVA